MMIGIGMALTLPRGGGTAFSPLTLFSSGEQGIWLDPSDLMTLYQDSAGTVPVTAASQPVGRILDKSGRGNHATQPVASCRPTLGRHPVGGLRNLLTFTEQFNNAAWFKAGATVTANQETNPLGSAVDADKVDATGVSSGVYITSSGNVVSGVDATISVWVKSATGSNQTIRFRGQTVSGTNVFSSAITVTNVWQRVSFTWTPSSTFPPTPGILTDASGTAFSVYLWGAQLEVGSTATPYQKVTSAYDVTEAGKADCWYLYTDPVDDALTVTVPIGGLANATIALALDTGVTILTGQTIPEGTWTLPLPRPSNCYGMVVVNRALTVAETAQLTKWLDAKRGV